MIRLSTAHAKCRLSKTIDIEDAQAAVELVQFAYFKKVWFSVCCLQVLARLVEVLQTAKIVLYLLKLFYSSVSF